MSGLNTGWATTYTKSWGGRDRGRLTARGVIACIVAVLALCTLGSCWTDTAAIEACGRVCFPRQVAKMSAEGCVCFTGCPGAAADGGTVSR